MSARERIFLDTSALFAGIWSATGGARLLLKLGEAGAIQLIASSQVLSEIEHVIRRKAPELLVMMALVLERTQIEITSQVNPEFLERCEVLLEHPGDRRVLAEAWTAGIDFFVTFDQEHFLSNSKLCNIVPFRIGSAGDCISWLGASFRDNR